MSKRVVKCNQGNCIFHDKDFENHCGAKNWVLKKCKDFETAYNSNTFSNEVAYNSDQKLNEVAYNGERF